MLSEFKEYEGYKCVEDEKDVELYLNQSVFTMSFNIQYYNFLEGKNNNIK